GGALASNLPSPYGWIGAWVAPHHLGEPNDLENSEDCRSAGGHGNQHVCLRSAQIMRKRSARLRQAPVASRGRRLVFRPPKNRFERTARSEVSSSLSSQAPRKPSAPSRSFPPDSENAPIFDRLYVIRFASVHLMSVIHTDCFRNGNDDSCKIILRSDVV